MREKEARKYIQKLYFRKESIPTMKWNDWAAIYKKYIADLEVGEMPQEWSVIHSSLKHVAGLSWMTTFAGFLLQESLSKAIAF